MNLFRLIKNKLTEKKRLREQVKELEERNKSLINDIKEILVNENPAKIIHWKLEFEMEEMCMFGDYNKQDEYQFKGLYDWGNKHTFDINNIIT